MKTVRLPVTVQAPGPAYVPNTWGWGGIEARGNIELVDCPAGSPVTLDDVEAEYALGRFGGDELDPDTGAVIRTVAPPQTAPEASRAAHVAGRR